MPALADTLLQGGDILYVIGAEPALADFLDAEGLERLSIEAARKQVVQELGLAEVMIPPNSELIGRTLREAEFRSRHSLSVLSVQRKGAPLETEFSRTKLELGDALLVGGGWKQIQLLQADRKDFLVLSMPAELEEVAPARSQAPVALLILLGMLVLMTFKLVPAVTAVLIAALAMVLFRCVSMEESYKAINWQSLVLIAGMLPMATALEQTGGVKLIVNSLITGLGDWGPYAVMAGLFVLASVLSQFISNTAATVLIAPVAVAAAQGMGVSPYTFLMTVAIAASTAFATPVSSPVNTLVLGPGGYRFNDFAKVGVPLIVLSMVVTLLVVPLVFPLH
jgi:di/tricarboxylate transporter